MNCTGSAIGPANIGMTDLFDPQSRLIRSASKTSDSRIYLAALDRLGVSPDAVMFFDDLSRKRGRSGGAGHSHLHVDGVQGVRERLIREHLL